MTGNAWLVSAMGDVRTYGGNDGYADEPESLYRWDSNVAHSREIKDGDYIVVRNKKISLGYSVIERVVPEDGVKTLRWCKFCGGSNINYRKTLGNYRCGSCEKGREGFTDPTSREVAVTHYTALYSFGWKNLTTVPSQDLRAMCLGSEGTQHSIRRIDWKKFSEAVVERTGSAPLQQVVNLQKQIAGGHSLATVRVRIGQAAFRQRLLDRYKENCAISGPCPKEALDAAHLYSFATSGEHHEEGGLLLRKDLHQLFDLGCLAVEPTTMLISQRGLDGFPEYVRLDSQPLQVTLSPGQRKWLKLHWQQHRQELA